MHVKDPKMGVNNIYFILKYSVLEDETKPADWSDLSKEEDINEEEELDEISLLDEDDDEITGKDNQNYQKEISI